MESDRDSVDNDFPPFLPFLVPTRSNIKFVSRTV